MRARIGLAGQSATVDGLLTARANLELVGRLYHLPRAVARRRADELLERLGLADDADRLVKTFSGGMRRRLDLAATLVATPPVLFLDEPTTGLDPAAAIELWELLRELVRDGMTLLLTTQYLDEADRLADDIVVLDHGRVVASGSPGELKARIGGERIDVTVVAPAGPRRGRGGARCLRRRTRVERSLRAGGDRARRPGTPLLEIVRALDGAGVAARDVHRREATLDDVFLTLTTARRRAAAPSSRGGCRLMAPSPPHLAAARRSAPAGSCPTASRWPAATSQHVRQIPEKLLDVTLQPIMFVLLFAFVFGNVIAVPGGDYRDYLIGGILVQSLAFGMMGPGTSIATDLGEGMVDRIRSLPTSRSAYLFGHFAAELAATLLAVVILCVTGFAIGWGIDSSVLEALGGVALLVAVRRGDDLARHAGRRDRPLARRRPGLRRS